MIFEYLICFVAGAFCIYSYYEFIVKEKWYEANEKVIKDIVERLNKKSKVK
jgi:hypothetical protein